jgi:hypothetical protein
MVERGGGGSVELFWGYGKALEMGREWSMTVKTSAEPLGSLVLFFAKKRGGLLSLGGVVQGRRSP